MHPTHPTPATAEPTPADILRGAAQYLQRYGWIQGDFYAATSISFPPACAVGAIRIAACGEPITDPYPDQCRVSTDQLDAIEAAQDIFAAYVDPDAWRRIDADFTSVSAITAWNDHADNIADEVAAALINAAHAWDHTHGGAR